jgi:hypothetical protein
MERKKSDSWEYGYDDNPEKRKKLRKLNSEKEGRFWQEDAEALNVEDWDEENLWDRNRFSGYSGCVRYRR